jgi:hypothetical protein
VIGFLDDLLAVMVGVKLLRWLIPADVLAECRELARAAETRRIAESRSSLALVGLVAIASLWFLALVTATALFAAYIHL